MITELIRLNNGALVVEVNTLQLHQKFPIYLNGKFVSDHKHRLKATKCIAVMVGTNRNASTNFIQYKLYFPT